MFSYKEIQRDCPDFTSISPNLSCYCNKQHWRKLNFISFWRVYIDNDLIFCKSSSRKKKNTEKYFSPINLCDTLRARGK